MFIQNVGRESNAPRAQYQPAAQSPVGSAKPSPAQYLPAVEKYLIFRDLKLNLHVHVHVDVHDSSQLTCAGQTVVHIISMRAVVVRPSRTFKLERRPSAFRAVGTAWAGRVEVRGCVVEAVVAGHAREACRLAFKAVVSPVHAREWIRCSFWAVVGDRALS